MHFLTSSMAELRHDTNDTPVVKILSKLPSRRLKSIGEQSDTGSTVSFVILSVSQLAPFASISLIPPFIRRDSLPVTSSQTPLSNASLRCTTSLCAPAACATPAAPLHSSASKTSWTACATGRPSRTSSRSSGGSWASSASASGSGATGAMCGAYFSFCTGSGRNGNAWRGGTRGQRYRSGRRCDAIPSLRIPVFHRFGALPLPLSPSPPLPSPPSHSLLYPWMTTSLCWLLVFF